MSNRSSLRARVAATVAIAGAMFAVAAGPATAAPVTADVASQIRLLPGATFVRSTPTISGTAQVGKTLTAGVGTVRPTGATIKYQWYRNGVAIYNAKARTYTLTASDYSKKITVKVTLSKTGYTTSSKTSAATATVKAGAISWSAPVLKGVPTLGVPITFSSGTIKPTGTKATYQWLRDGVAIPGATASTYTPVEADVDHRLQVKVTRSATGYTTASKSSYSGETVGEAAPVLTGDGTFVVGVDIQPGTYYTNVPSDHYCVWATSDSVDSEDFNAFDFDNGRMYVTIEETDGAFFADDCGAWRAIPTVGAKAATIPTSGYFAVGIDILPGTYQTTTAKVENCWWIRASVPGLTDIPAIDEDYEVDSSTVTVTVEATDKFFYTWGCGTWSRISE